MTGPARLTAVCAVLAALLFAALGVIVETSLSPGGRDPFDSRFFGYGHAAALDYLKALAAEKGGRETYLGTFRWLDTAFPVVLAATFAGVIWVNSRMLPLPVRLVLLAAPACYLVADLIENARVAGMLASGEAARASDVRAASAATQVKWLCVGLSLFSMLAAWGQRRMRERALA